MNVVVLKGRLTKDPTVNYSNGGNQWARFSVAVDRKVKQGDQWVSQADFINCVAFGKTAEMVGNYLHKGSEIALEGSIRTGSYTKDGQRVFTTDVYADRIEFCGSKAENNRDDNRGDNRAVTGANAVNDGFMGIPSDIGEDDGIPF